MENLSEVLSEILVAVITISVPIIVKYVVSYLHSLKTKVKKNVSDTEFQNTLSETISLIENVVDTVSQVYVDSLKKEGKFNKEAQENSFNMAMDSIKSMVSAESENILRSMYDDYDLWLKTQIESYIKSTKKVVEG